MMISPPTTTSSPDTVGSMVKTTSSSHSHSAQPVKTGSRKADAATPPGPVAFLHLRPCATSRPLLTPPPLATPMRWHANTSEDDRDTFFQGDAHVHTHAHSFVTIDNSRNGASVGSLSPIPHHTASLCSTQGATKMTATAATIMPSLVGSSPISSSSSASAASSTASPAATAVSDDDDNHTSDGKAAVKAKITGAASKRLRSLTRKAITRPSMIACRIYPKQRRPIRAAAGRYALRSPPPVAVVMIPCALPPAPALPCLRPGEIIPRKRS